MSVDWIPVDRAVALLRPIRPSPPQFEPSASANELLRTLIALGTIAARFEIAPPIAHPMIERLEAGSPAWWNAVFNDRPIEAQNAAGWGSWVSSFNAWFDESVKVSASDVMSLRRPEYTATEDDEVRARRASLWILPQVIAWFATRDMRSVAQVSDPEAWRPFASRWASPLADLVGGSRRRIAISWLVASVADRWCACGARSGDAAVDWRRCTCVTDALGKIKNAMDDGHLIPASSLTAHEIKSLNCDVEKFTIAPEHLDSIEFAAPDVRRLWPAPVVHKFSAGGGAPSFGDDLTAGIPTGMAGRPQKGKDLIADELRRRAGEGELCSNVTTEAEALIKWFALHFPNAQRPRPKTVTNNIRADYRRLKSAA